MQPHCMAEVPQLQIQQPQVGRAFLEKPIPDPDGGLNSIDAFKILLDSIDILCIWFLAWVCNQLSITSGPQGSK